MCARALVLEEIVLGVRKVQSPWQFLVTLAMRLSSGEVEYSLPCRAEWEDLPLELRAEYAIVVQSLAAVLSQLNIEEDVYAVGSLGRMLGEKLVAAPRAKGQIFGEKQKASVILLDRVRILCCRFCEHCFSS